MSDWPFFDEEEIAAVVEVLRSGKVNYRVGHVGATFEREWAEVFGVRHAYAVANGTVALELALRALRLGQNDEVIVPARGFVATASAVVSSGGQVRFADVDASTGNVSAETVARCLTHRTRAIIVVHLGGWPCEMTPLLSLAREADVPVIEDCAQAHGATYRDRLVGTFGFAGTFSFCQEKIISTGGEGGLVMCDDHDYGRRIALLRDHGKTPTPPGQGGSAAWRRAVDGERRAPVYRYIHEAVGGNGRLTEMQSALGRIGLARLRERVEARRAIARRLQAALDGQSALVAPPPPGHLAPAWYRFYCRVDPVALASGWSRDRVLLALTDAGAPAGSGACPTLQRERAFEPHLLPSDVHAPGAERLGERSVALAIHHAMDESQVDQMCAALHQVGRSAQR